MASTANSPARQSRTSNFQASVNDAEPPVLKFEEAWLDLKDLATLDLSQYAHHFTNIGSASCNQSAQISADTKL